MKAAAPGEQNAKTAAEPPEQISPERVRAALDKILSSPGFATAERLTRFLRYVVLETLDGQPDKLKETLLGIEVFGRKPSYDPRIDAVVRTEAVKLRARLRDYYETEGREDPVRIDLPKGGYVPVFRAREAEPELEPVIAAQTAPLLADVAVPRRRLTYALVIAATMCFCFLAWYVARRQLRTERVAELSSIAVLPFEDLSPQHDQEYFCDGMTEEIIDTLTKVGGIRVVARTSSFAFKGKQQDIREIGRKLNVGAVLEGSVRKFGNKLRVTAQLNSVADGYHLWSDTYEREVKDVFSLQDEIARSISTRLQWTIADRASRRPPENLEAYDLYLKGLYHWRRWRREGAEQAQRYFEQAIAKDPRYALAYSGLADTYTWMGFFGVLQPSDAMPKARAAAQKAIQLDDSLAAAHVSLADVKALYDFDWAGAQNEFLRAIQLNPGLADAHFAYGVVYLIPNGNNAEAIRELTRAHDLDPLGLQENTYLGFAYQLDGQMDKAVEFYKQALNLDPEFLEARAHLAISYLGRRMFKEFDLEVDQIGRGAASCRIQLLRASELAMQGKKAEALAIVHAWERPPDGTWVRPVSIASVYAALGDRGQTLSWLEKAYEQRDGALAYITRDRAFDDYRSDPRFQAVIRKVGLSR